MQKTFNASITCNSSSVLLIKNPYSSIELAGLNGIKRGLQAVWCCSRKMVDDRWNIKVLSGLVTDSEDCGRAEAVLFFTLSFCHLGSGFGTKSEGNK